MQEVGLSGHSKGSRIMCMRSIITPEVADAAAPPYWIGVSRSSARATASTGRGPGASSGRGTIRTRTGTLARGRSSPQGACRVPQFVDHP
jgi:hypothetical protein